MGRWILCLAEEPAGHVLNIIYIIRRYGDAAGQLGFIRFAVKTTRRSFAVSFFRAQPFGVAGDRLLPAQSRALYTGRTAVSLHGQVDLRIFAWHAVWHLVGAFGFITLWVFNHVRFNEQQEMWS